MKRLIKRTPLCAAILGLAFAFMPPAQTRANASEIILKDSKMLVAFDSGSGAIVRMENLETGWVMQRRPELGVSFRLHAPLPDRHDNFVLGQKQRAARVEKISGGEVRLQWTNLASEHGGTLPVTLDAAVTLADGKLRFTGKVTNSSSLTVESIEYPYIGDLNAPSRDSKLAARTMWYGNLGSEEIYPRFDNQKGYWGVLYPMKTFDSNKSIICLLQSQGQGLYVGIEDPYQQYFVQYTFEEYPGVVDSINKKVPRQDEISGLPVHIAFRLCHFVYVAPGASKELLPVVLKNYAGDWQAGVDIYKEWRKTWFKPARVPAWALDVHSWLQLQINGAEDDLRVPFTKLAEYGRECADNGVGAIQLVGWNFGGQDRNDPLQDQDYRLGTQQELKDAIAKIQAMGVKMILFGKLNWADMTTQSYKDTYKKHCTVDPYGIPYMQGGYSYTTPTQLAGINTRRRGVLDFSSPACRDELTKEFSKVMQYGASGWLFDENCHHSPAKFCFDPNHGHPVPGYVFNGDMPLAAQTRAVADKVNPDFLFAGEGHMDWLKQYYPCMYFRINADTTAVDRYIDSKAPLMVAVTGVDDREMLNLILMLRYIISYEPYNFKGHVTDFPLTLAYGKKIDALRKKYREWIWDAEYRDTLGAKVTADAGEARSGRGGGTYRYSVFKTASGKSAVIVINTSADRELHATVELEGARVTGFKMATPEKPDAVDCNDGKVTIPARSAVVLMEK